MKNVTFVNFKVITMSDKNYFIDPFKQKALFLFFILFIIFPQ